MDFDGEFVNRKFSDSKATGTKWKATAAKFAWSNGVAAECHNLVLDDLLNKIRAENNTNIEIVKAWCVNLKNLLQNIKGFLPISLLHPITHNRPTADQHQK